MPSLKKFREMAGLPDTIRRWSDAAEHVRQAEKALVNQQAPAGQSQHQLMAFDKPPSIIGMNLNNYIGTKYTRYANWLTLKQPDVKHVKVRGLDSLWLKVEFEFPPLEKVLAFPYATEWELVVDGQAIDVKTGAAPGDKHGTVWFNFGRDIPNEPSKLELRVTVLYHNAPELGDDGTQATGGRVWGESYTGCSIVTQPVTVEWRDGQYLHINGKRVEPAYLPPD